MSDLHGHKIGSVVLSGIDPDWHDNDARGILWVWEEPQPNALYVLGVDPTVGIMGWNRTRRNRDDVKTDNACIQVLKVGRHTPDVQVAEYAAPVDPIEFASIVNAVGHLYAGAAEDGVALAIIEITGPGIGTQRELMVRYGYMNLFVQPYLDTLQPRANAIYGWTSTEKSKQVLWTKTMRHLHAGNVLLNSPWLVDPEMADISDERFLSRAKKQWMGKHDDRVVALMLAVWAAHDWTFDLGEVEHTQVENPNQHTVDYQCTDLTAEEAAQEAEEQFGRLVGW